MLALSDSQAAGIPHGVWWQRRRRSARQCQWHHAAGTAAPPPCHQPGMTENSAATDHDIFTSLCSIPIEFQTHCVPDPLCSNPLCSRPTVFQTHCVPEPLCSNPLRSRPTVFQPTAFQTHCVPDPLCSKHTVFLNHSVLDSLWQIFIEIQTCSVPFPPISRPTVPQSHYVPHPVCLHPTEIMKERIPWVACRAWYPHLQRG